MPINANKARSGWNPSPDIKPLNITAEFPCSVVNQWDIAQVADCLIEDKEYEGYDFDPQVSVRELAEYDAEQLIEKRLFLLLQRRQALEQSLSNAALAEVRYIA